MAGACLWVKMVTRKGPSVMSSGDWSGVPIAAAALIRTLLRVRDAAAPWASSLCCEVMSNKTY